jgi:hypothetical protein
MLQHQLKPLSFVSMRPNLRLFSKRSMLLTNLVLSQDCILMGNLKVKKIRVNVTAIQSYGTN